MKPLRGFFGKLAGTSIALLLAACASTPVQTTAPCELARRYVEAGNASDPQRIAPLLSPAVVAVFLVDGADHAETIEGRQAVLSAVKDYKTQCPSCESKVICRLETASAAYVTERVTFENEAGQKQQQVAPLIIEFDTSGITHIIYYPAD